MNSVLDILNKFVEKTVLFPAGALTALTVLLARGYGYFVDLRAEVTWLSMAGIFCAWVTATLWG